MLLAILWYAAIIYSVGTTLTASEIKADSLAPADAMQKIYSGVWAKSLLILAGLAGIVTSWNSFFVGATRAIYAMGYSGMLPKVFAILHPQYKSPTTAIIFVTGTSIIATLFGKEAMTWLINAGGLGIVISWSLVALSFYRLRKMEPNLARPFKVSFGKAIGIIAFLSSLALLYLYLPGKPSALNAIEWSIVAAWLIIGLIFYLWASRIYKRQGMRELMDAHLE